MTGPSASFSAGSFVAPVASRKVVTRALVLERSEIVP
jgi:hypothetical protein